MRRIRYPLLRAGGEEFPAEVSLARVRLQGELWFTAFVGVNLFQSGFTGWCPMMTILRKAGMPHAQVEKTRA